MYVALRDDTSDSIFLSYIKTEGHTHTLVNHGNLSRLLANLSWLVRKSAGDRRTNEPRYEA